RAAPGRGRLRRCEGTDGERRPGRRVDLVAGRRGLRTPGRDLRAELVHREVEALRGGLRSVGRLMAVSAPPAVASRGLIRDPVLVLPGAVLGGLAAGLLGAHAGVAGTRIAADLALAWALALAAVVVVER